MVLWMVATMAGSMDNRMDVPLGKLKVGLLVFVKDMTMVLMLVG